MAASEWSKPVLLSENTEWKAGIADQVRIGEFPLLDTSREEGKILPMKVSLPLKEMTLSEKMGMMEEIWSDLAGGREYTPPDWHGRILEERARLAESGAVGFTDWETAKKQIRDRVS